MKIEVLSLFPDFFDSFLASSMVARAISKSALTVESYDIRAHATNKHHQVDDYPYGGFAGMVGMIQPLWDALKARLQSGNAPVIYFSPQGRPLKQKILCDYALEPRVILICGHYKEIDQRFRRLGVSDEISIGDYVLTNGALPAAVVIDAVVRLRPGVLGAEGAAEQESFEGGLLEHEQYTRPAEFRGMRVPDVLVSGDHAEIARWRAMRARERTLERRPDLEKNQ